jgi:hypothetical protein
MVPKCPWFICCPRRVKSRRMRCPGYVAHTGRMRNIYRMLVIKPERKRQLGASMNGW